MPKGLREDSLGLSPAPPMRVAKSGAAENEVGEPRGHRPATPADRAQYQERGPSSQVVPTLWQHHGVIPKLNLLHCDGQPRGRRGHYYY